MFPHATVMLIVYYTLYQIYIFFESFIQNIVTVVIKMHNTQRKPVPAIEIGRILPGKGFLIRITILKKS